MYHYKSCGLDNVWLENGYLEKDFGDQKAVSIHALDELHELISMELVRKDNVLSGKEFRFLRKELDMSQRALGHLLDVTDQAVAKWEKNDNVPRYADVLLRHLYAESVGDNPKVRNMLERLNDIDREYQHTIKLTKNAEDHWAVAL